MKVSNKNLSSFISFMILCAVMGTLAWQLLEVLLNLAGLNLKLTAGPVGFDIDVLAIYIKANPGSLLGAAAGWLLFKKI